MASYLVEMKVGLRVDEMAGKKVEKMGIERVDSMVEKKVAM
jgi:hypothetical protein